MSENAVRQSDPDGTSSRSPSAIRPFSLSYRISRSPRSLNFPTGIQDRCPRHSKHPSLLAMRAVFSVFLVQTWAGSQNLLRSVAKPQGRGFLPWKPVTLPHVVQLPIAVPPLCWLPVMLWLPLPLALLSHRWYVEPAGITVV